MDHEMTGFEAIVGGLTLLAQLLLWLYWREDGIRDWLEYRKFLRKIKEGKSFTIDVATP